MSLCLSLRIYAAKAMVLLVFLSCPLMIGNVQSKSREEIKVVLAGSYHKHIDDICKIKAQMERNGIKVLEPLCGKPINKGGDFIVLENDNPKKLDDATYHSIQKRFMDHCQQADIIYIYNKGGYIGLSTAFETGYSKRPG